MVSFDWLKRHARDFDFGLLVALIGLAIISFLAVYSATINRPLYDGWYKKQILWQVLGFSVFFLLVLNDYRIFTNSRLLWTGYAITLLLLVVVLFFEDVNGARSWIPLPGFQLQPSELGKLFAIMGMANYLAKMQEKEEELNWRHVGKLFAIWAGPFFLIMLEPDLGQGLVMVGLFVAMLMVVMDRKPLLIFGSIAGGIMILHFVGVTMFPEIYLKAVNLLPLADYQKARFVAVVDTSLAGKYGFQLTQAMIAIGSGQLFGKGYLQGSQTQGAFVPEQQTDYVFTVIGEEFGFIGSAAVVILYFVLLQRLTKIALTSHDSFGTFFIAGAIGMFGFQIFENIGMNLGLMPATGITLPFLSYGGTSLLTNFIIMGIIQSIAIRRRKLRF